MRFITSYDEYLNENIANIQLVMKASNITYIRYLAKKSNRKGIKDVYSNLALYNGYAIAHTSNMRDFIIEVQKFIQNKSKVEKYIDNCFKIVQAIDPKAMLKYYQPVTKREMEERHGLWGTNHIPSSGMNKYSSTPLCKIYLTYEKYMGYVDVKLKNFKDSDNVLKVRDVEDEMYTEMQFKIDNMTNLKSILDNILPTQIKDWTEKIDKNFNDIHKCPAHVLKHIYPEHFIKIKDIGVWDD